MTEMEHMIRKTRSLQARNKALRRDIALLYLAIIAICLLFGWQLWNAKETLEVVTTSYENRIAMLKEDVAFLEGQAVEASLVDAELVGTFMTTAYCCEKYEHICGEGHGITYSGQPVQAGVSVAADPNVLPMGSVIYIEDVGIRIVQDIGGAIKGNRLDVAVDTHENALAWSGYGEHAVYVLHINN